MKSHPLGPHIRVRRAALGLTQEDVGRALGVPRDAIARYEAERRGVPLALIPVLAHVLEEDPVVLEGLRDGVRRAAVGIVSQRARVRPVSCPLADMARHPALRPLHDEVRESLGVGRYADMETGFMRQTPWEAALGFLALSHGAEPLWTSPQEAGSRLLVVGEDRRTSEGHLLRLAVSWQRDGERVVLFPQVPLLAPRLDKTYRVDYLAVHLAPHKPAANVVLELDGGVHDNRRGHDELRAEDLRLPLLRFDNSAVTSSGFFSHLVACVREKAAAARLSDGEFARFLQQRRRRFDASSA